MYSKPINVTLMCVYWRVTCTVVCEMFVPLGGNWINSVAEIFRYIYRPKSWASVSGNDGSFSVLHHVHIGCWF
jgi:hypothetical protein